MKDGRQEERIAWFASMKPVLPEEMVGLWRGTGIPSGHPLDGVMENLGWFGKRFQPDLKADALLFQCRPGRVVPLEPSFFPIELAIRLAPFAKTFVARNLFSHLQEVFRARDTTAMLTLRRIDGAETTAMVYDKQPIADFFRRVDDHEVAGMMVVDATNRDTSSGSGKFHRRRRAPLEEGRSHFWRRPTAATSRNCAIGWNQGRPRPSSRFHLAAAPLRWV